MRSRTRMGGCAEHRAPLMKHLIHLSFIALASVSFATHASAARSISDLAELTVLGPFRAQMNACSSLHAAQAQEYASALNQLSSRVGNSLAALQSQRAAELAADAPEALFLHQEGMANLYLAESQNLSSERCDFLAADIHTISPAELDAIVSDVVGELLEAGKAYREGVERATQ